MNAVRMIQEGLYHQSMDHVVVCRTCGTPDDNNFTRGQEPERCWCKTCLDWQPVWIPGCQWHGVSPGVVQEVLFLG